MGVDSRALTGSVLVALLVAGGARLHPAPRPVAERVVYLDGEGTRPGWYEADALGEAAAAAGGTLRFLAAPVADGGHLRLVGVYGVDPTPPPPVETEAWIPGKLHLNSATLSELEGLPRVGPVLAARIVAGRPYRSVAELDRVKGIGAHTLAQLAPLVAP